MQIIKHPIQLMLISLLVILGMPLEAGESLTGEEIKQLFYNKTFEGIHLKNGWTFRNHAAPDGRCEVLFIGGKRAGQTRTYRWFVKDNMHCCDTGRRHICGTITDEGNGVYHKHRNGKKHIQTFMNFVSGPQL